MILSAKDLSPDQRVAVESMLGRQIGETESVSVRTIETPAMPQERRRELADQLREYFAKVDAGRMPGSAEDAEEIITEAMRSVRSSYRPRR